MDLFATWVVLRGRPHRACGVQPRHPHSGNRPGNLVAGQRTSRPAGPLHLALTPDDAVLVATLKQGAAVQFFDLEAGRALAVAGSSTTVTHGVVVSPDGRYAFVSVEGVGAEPGKVDIFDLADFSRVAEVEVGQQAGGIAFWKMERSAGHDGTGAAQPTGTVTLSSSQEK